MTSIAGDTVASVEEHRRQRSFFDHRTGRVYRAIRDIPGPLDISSAAAAAFLHLGYVPGTATLYQGVDCLPGGTTIALAGSGWRVLTRLRYADLIRAQPYGIASLSTPAVHELGMRIFDTALCRSLSETGTVVVPLSGGFDSRTILAALLEHLSPREIASYTYGVPGTLDFDIGNRVAEVAGTRHTVIDERELSFDADGLIETARISDANSSLFHAFVWTEVRRRFGTNVTYWSGFTGDGIAGASCQPGDSATGDGVSEFMAAEGAPSFWKHDARVTSTVERLVARDTKYDGVLAPREAVWFENHVERYAAHQIFMAGLTYATPFMDDAFVRFMLEAGPRHRTGKRMFERMVTGRFTKLFQLPTRSSGYLLSDRPMRHGPWRARQLLRQAQYRLTRHRTTHPHTAYLDFGRALRDRHDVRAVVRPWLEDLSARGLVEPRDLLRFWTEHQQGADHRRTLLHLASLEGCIKAFGDR